MQQNEFYDQNDINTTKNLAWLSYLGFLFIIPLLVYKNSPYIKFHVNQGVVLFIISLISSIVRLVLQFIPFFGGILSTAINVGIIVLAILGIINAIQGQAKRLPLIGDIQIVK